MKRNVLIISLLAIVYIAELIISTNVYSVLPSPLVHKGVKIKNINDWNLKKEEIKKILLNEQFGTIPNIPKFTAKIIEEEEFKNSIKQNIEIQIITNEGQNLSFKAVSYLIKNKKNRPTIICVDTNKCNKDNLVETSINNDYNFITYETEKLSIGLPNIETDTLSPELTENPEAIIQLREIYKDYTWGALAIRAWLGLIVTEYIKEIEGIDINKLIVTGHSRNGKVALILGFINEQFIITNPVHSGITGASVVKFYGYKSSELDYLTSHNRFHYWYEKNYSKKYRRNEKKMSFDSHFQLALISPRNLFIQVSNMPFDNPIGSQLAYEGALPVYKLMKAENNLSISFSNYGHRHTNLEIQELIDYANYKLINQKNSNKYNKLKFSRIDKIKTLLYSRYKMSKYKMVKIIKRIIY